MKVKKGEKATILKPKSDNLQDFVQKIQADKTLQSENLILDLSQYDLRKSSLNLFIDLSASHKEENKKSFVIITGELSYDEIPEELSVAPTLLEASDIVELEEIERDLGF